MEAYIGSRTLPNSPAGCSLFVTLLYTSQQPPMMIGKKMVTAREVAQGKYAIVFSVKVLGKLEVEFFNFQDMAAVQAHFEEAESSEVQIAKVASQFNEPFLVGQFISLTGTFMLNQQVAPSYFTTSMFNLNPNCWVHSLLDYTGGYLSKKVKGVDITNQLRIPRAYFEPYIPPIEKEANPEENECDVSDE